MSYFKVMKKSDLALKHCRRRIAILCPYSRKKETEFHEIAAQKLEIFFGLLKNSFFQDILLCKNTVFFINSAISDIHIPYF